MNDDIGLVIYGLACIGLIHLIFSIYSFIFEERSEPVDGLTYLPGVSRAIGVEMELKLENGVVTLWLVKPDTQETIEIALVNFDKKVRQIMNEDKIEAVKFVRKVTQWSLVESKNYVDNLVV